LSKEENKGDIEFTYYDRDNLEAEETIQIEKEDLTDANLQVRVSTEEMLEKYGIPLDVIRNNKFIPIHKQITLIQFLRSEPELLEYLHFSTNLPTSEQLDAILSISYNHLFNNADGVDNQNYTLPQLQMFTKFYVYKQPGLKEIVSKHSSENIDTRVRNAFHLVSHFFEFAIPKYLTAFEGLFNFVYHEQKLGETRMNLSFLITVLEFGHANPNEIALKEAGVPNEIIGKVASKFTDCNTLEQVRIKYQLNPSLVKSLSPFEKKLFDRYI